MQVYTCLARVGLALAIHVNKKMGFGCGLQCSFSANRFSSKNAKNGPPEPKDSKWPDLLLPKDLDASLQFWHPAIPAVPIQRNWCTISGLANNQGRQD